MKRGGTGVGVGTSSILMVFVLLCLTTFATLALVSAGADYRLVSRASDTMQEFYEADAQAERVLAELADILRQSHVASSETEYRASYQAKAESLSVPVTFEGETASFVIPAGETQQLEVILQLPHPGAVLYRKLQWQMTPTEWQSEENGDGMMLWNGSFETMPIF